MRQDSQICENQTPEVFQGKGSGSPQTIQTYSDLKQTLSENERENFKSFCQRKTKQYEKPVVLLESWIEKHFEELYEEYLKVYGQDKCSGGVVQRNSKIISPSKNVGEASCEEVPELELAIACALQAKKENQIRDFYWSSIHNCDCVVLLNGAIMPICEWMADRDAQRELRSLPAQGNPQGVAEVEL